MTDRDPLRDEIILQALEVIEQRLEAEYSRPPTWSTDDPPLHRAACAIASRLLDDIGVNGRGGCPLCQG